MDHHPNKGSHHGPEWGEKTRKNGSQMQGEAQRGSGQKISRILREIDKWNRNKLHGLLHKRTRNSRHSYIKHSPHQADHRTNRKHAPAPCNIPTAFFCQCHSPLCGNGCKWKRQLLVIGRDAEQHITGGKPGNAPHNCAQYQQCNGPKPIGV